MYERECNLTVSQPDVTNNEISTYVKFGIDNFKLDQLGDFQFHRSLGFKPIYNTDNRFIVEFSECANLPLNLQWARVADYGLHLAIMEP